MMRVSVACAIALQPLIVQSGELTFTPVLDVSAVTYETKHPDTDEKSDNNALMLEPVLATTYKSQLLNAALRIKNTTVKQSENSAELDKEFTDVNFNSKMGFWDRRLLFTAQSNRIHRAQLGIDSGISDPILNAEELSTVQTNNASMSFSPQRPAYLGMSFFARAGESRTRSNPSAQNQFADIDSDSYSGGASIFQGQEITRMFWNINANYEKTKRDAQPDVISRSVSAKIGVGILSDLHLIAVGSDYNNEGLRGGLQQENISSKSYGAGLEWRRASGSFLGVTYNKFKHEGKETNYVGFDLNWALSPRSSVQASYDKRFFGDNYNFSLNHNSRSWRTRVGYEKGFTSYSQLQLVPGAPIVLVCPQGSLDFSQCFMPDSPNYEPDVDETQISIPTFENELTDEIIIRESAFINLGYDKRKLSMYFNYSYSNLEYLETMRAQRTRAAQLTLTYKLGAKTKLIAHGEYSRNDTLQGTFYDEEVVSYKLALDRALSKKADLSLSLRYLDRDTDQANRALEDTRLSLKYSYKF